MVRVIHSLSWNELSPMQIYDILRLRVDVFVVEQACPYPELDGRDVEPGAVHVFAEDDAVVRGYLRILDDADQVRRIGRVCVRADARGDGIAGQLMACAIDVIGCAPSVLDAQAHLADWYGRFGYEVDGTEFLEDGIPHVPMRRSPMRRRQ